MQIKTLLKNSILKNVATLVSGTAIAQLILIGFQLILRRLYEPEVFGAFAIYMSITGILIILSTLRYELAVVLPEEERKANSIVVGGITISLIINTIILLVIIFFKNNIINILGFPAKFGFWLYFVPLSTFLFSSYQMLNYWLTRKGAFVSIAINKVFRRVFEGLTQTGFGAFTANIGLVIGDIVGSIANIFSGIHQVRKNGYTLKTVSLKKIKSSLKRYIGFPKYQAFPAILNTTSMLLPVFMINEYFSTSTVGYYDLSRQILTVPIAFITASLSQVLLKDFNDKLRKKNPLTKSVLKTSLLLTLCIIPFVIIIGFWGKEVFSFLFSNTWEQSGIYSAILVPAFAIQFIVSPLSISFTVLEKLKTLAIWQILYFVAILSLIYFKYLSIENFLLLYTIINLSAYLIYYVLILLICRKYDKSL